MCQFDNSLTRRIGQRSSTHEYAAQLIYAAVTCWDWSKLNRKNRLVFWLRLRLTPRDVEFAFGHTISILRKIRTKITINGQRLHWTNYGHPQAKELERNKRSDERVTAKVYLLVICKHVNRHKYVSTLAFKMRDFNTTRGQLVTQMKWIRSPHTSKIHFVFPNLCCAFCAWLKSEDFEECRTDTKSKTNLVERYILHWTVKLSSIDGYCLGIYVFDCSFWTGQNDVNTFWVHMSPTYAHSAA